MSTEQPENKFKSRKWIGFLILCLLSLFALYTGKIDGEQWTDFLFWIFCIFAGGNVAEAATSGKFIK